MTLQERNNHNKELGCYGILGGRKKKFNTINELEQSIYQYFEQCNKDYIVPTFKDLLVELDICDKTLQKYLCSSNSDHISKLISELKKGK